MNPDHSQSLADVQSLPGGPLRSFVIAMCIRQVAAHKGNRGDLQSQRICAARLGGSAIDLAAAAAARRLGVFLREWKA